VNICPNCGAWGDVGAGHACISIGAAAQPAQEPDYEAMEREHFGDPDKGTGIYATSSPQESAAAASMTEQEVRNSLAQFDKAREDFNNWPKWMQDAARVAAATFPRSSGVDSPDGEQR
jgi:hypothetical protein